MSAIVPPSNVEAEQSVLGAVLLADTVLPALLLDEGLKPEHFYRDQHGATFAAMLALHDAGTAVDVLTLTDQMDRDATLDRAGGRAAIDALAGVAPAAGNAREYARLVVRAARWRHRLATLQHGLAAVADRDEDAFLEVEARLAGADDSGESRTSSPQQLAHELWEYLNSTADDAITSPFAAINEGLAGGFRPGDVTWIAGWTNHGKSVLTNQLLAHAASGGARVHLYINEMAKRDRALRDLAALSGVRFHDLLMAPRRPLDARSAAAAAGALRRLPFGITDCSGWTATEVARHIRRNGWDLAGIDSVNLVRKLPTLSGVAAIDEVSGTINAAARQAGCHLFGVLMLNRERQRDGIDPVPVLRDLRESGRLEYDAANVLFVHRDQEPITVNGAETGRYRKLPDAGVLLAKARNGLADTGVKVTLSARTMTFEPQLERP